MGNANHIALCPTQLERTSPHTRKRGQKHYQRANHTPAHPFYLEQNVDGSTRPKPEGYGNLTKQWVGAGDLKVGDKVRQSDGSTSTVVFIKNTTEARTMYNLSVAVAQTYYVGEGQWLVHNCPPGDGGGYLKKGFVPLPNNGMGTVEVGEAVGWGTDVAGASKRLEEVANLPDAYFTDLASKGLDLDYMRALANGYREATQAGRGGNTAPLRAQLIDAMVERMEKTQKR